MILEGHIKHGRILFNTSVVLPEVAKVTVHVHAESIAPESTDELPTLFDRLKSVVGQAKGLPEDLAINHDHYLHRQPKRQ